MKTIYESTIGTIVAMAALKCDTEAYQVEELEFEEIIAIDAIPSVSIEELVVLSDN